MTDATRLEIDLLDGRFYAGDCHPAYAWMRAHEPVYLDHAHGVWGAAGYDAVLAASKDPATFSSAGGIRPDSGPVPMMIDMDDPDHWQRRKLVNRGFTPGRVRAQEESIRRTARVLIDAVRERETFDLVWDLAGWLPLIVIGDALGVEPPGRQQLLDWSDDLMRSLGSGDEELMTKAMLASVGYHEYASKIIKARRATPAEDLMGVLTAAEVDGDRLDDAEI